MNTKTANEIFGSVDFRTCGQSDHEITAEEHDFAVEIGHEIASRHGLDLDAMVAAQYESETI